jgi:glycosyltransferase involved in cell wall biosynthesis
MTQNEVYSRTNSGQTPDTYNLKNSQLAPSIHLLCHQFFIIDSFSLLLHTQVPQFRTNLFLMKFSKILVLREFNQTPKHTADTQVVPIQELGQWVRTGAILKRLFRYKEACLYTFNWDFTTKPFLVSLALRLLTLGDCRIRDEQGKDLPVSLTHFGRTLLEFTKDFLAKASLINKRTNEVRSISKTIESQSKTKTFNPSAQPVYMRSDHCFGLKAGGSVGHTVGVLNNFETFTASPIFLTTTPFPGIDPNIEMQMILPNRRFLDFLELPLLNFNDQLLSGSIYFLSERTLSFIYQRYALYNYSGLQLALHKNIPFVLEYNGSEIWVNKNWGKGLKYEKIAEQIEILNLRGADVVVVVSAPSRDELIERGIESDKILVNPNGVNPEAYSPEVDGSAIRRKHNLEARTVIGFIGTFGKWHGAEILAQAFGLLIQKHPQYRGNTRLLMIGNGHTMSQVQQELETYGVTQECILTGIVPQEEGPAHLAACDLLASPHVPNPDGTPFFGSPTKLFEYMAMGKGIIASDLDQIGEVLEHDHTAWMVKPGDAESLMHGLKAMIDDPETSKRLGEAARREVVAKYTWKEHTRKIIEKLKERCPCD